MSIMAQILFSWILTVGYQPAGFVNGHYVSDTHTVVIVMRAR